MSNRVINIIPDDEVHHKANPTGERFLFVFTPDEPAIQGLCGCSLKTCSQLIALFFIMCIVPAFMNSFNSKDIMDILFYLTASVLYFVAGVSVLYSSISYSYVYAHTASLIYNFCFVINLINYVIVIILVFRGTYVPTDANIDSFTLGLYMTAASVVILLIHSYLLWIIFSYMVHLKHGRISLVKGYVYKSYEEFDKENVHIERL
jgi:hypothetical protein